MSALDVARNLLAEGIRPIPIGFRQKKPKDAAWQKMRIDETNVDRHFNGVPQNVGGLLGEPSGHLHDVDLDCKEAIELADAFLLPSREFERPSKPRSHRLCRTTSSKGTRRFKDPNGQTLVELRANGGQTVMPGSTHESGEAIEWVDRDVPIALVDRDDLERRVERLAAASLLRRYVPASHHVEAAHALAFGLCEGDWDLAEARTFVENVFPGTSFDADALAASRGWDGLAELAGENGARVVGTIEAWLDVRRPTADEARDPKLDARDEKSGGVPGVEVAELEAIDLATRERRATAYAKTLDPSVAGKGGHNKAIRAATSIACRFALPHDRAFAVLSGEWNAKCSPPWSPRELHHKIASALECMHGAWGSLLLVKREETKPATPAPARRLGDVAREMAKAGAVVRLPTGIAALDDAMRGGFPTPRLVIVGGAPGAAKTSFVNFLANGWARSGITVGLLAIDEGAEGSVMRLAQMAGHGVAGLESGDPVAWASVVEQLDALPILVSDDSSTIESLASELRAAAGPDAPAVFIVDSIQTARARGTDEADGPRARIDAVVRALKGVVREHRLLTLATCELARGSYRSKQAAEQINDLAAFKESGGIEYAAQTAFVLRNVLDEDDLFDVAVPKNRAHAKVPFRLRMDRRTASFVEVPVENDGAEGGAPVGRTRGGTGQAERDALVVEKLLVENPGVAGQAKMRALVRGRAGGSPIGNARIDAAIAFLGVTTPSAPNGSARIEDRPEKGRPRWFSRPAWTVADSDSEGGES